MFLFKKQPASCLGIDVGASAVRVVELDKKEERPRLKNYGIFSIKKYLKQDWYKTTSKSDKLDAQELAKIIKMTLKRAKISSKDCYLALPAYSSFFTLVDLPQMTDKEINKAVPFEARKYVPVPVSEVVLDWSLVSSINQKSQNKGKDKNIQILLIAIPKEIVSRYQQAIQLAGLNLLSQEGESFSASRSLVGNDQSSIILIDIGARSINISIVDKGYIRVVSNLEMGGLKITKKIAEQMNINLEEAEKIKTNFNSSQLSQEKKYQLKKISQSILDVIILEIKKIIDSYQNKYQRKIEKCILTGDSARLPELDSYFANKLSLEVSLGNPFARIVYPESLGPAIGDLNSSLAVAIGLAMKGD